MIGVDLRKQVWRLRTYLALGLMAAIPIIITLAFKFGGPPRERGQEDLFRLATHSGLNLPLAALVAMTSFLLPVVVALFAGGAIAEEASWGSLRYLLVRPVSRGRLLASKLAVSALLAVVATLIISITGLVGGVAAFGWHPVTIPSLDNLSLTTMSQGDAFLRLVGATFYVAWSMATVLSFAFMLSTMTDAALGAVSGGIGLTIVSEILDGIPPLKTSRNFLPTHYFQSWNGLFQQPMATGDIVRGALIQLPYAIAFLTFAWWWFHRKDIVS
jgi:ABC-type transport system involved in multi-copper enzyme maturation, permease component